MTRLNCEYVVELYPDVLNGKLTAEAAEAVRTHIASCDECRAAAALLDIVYADQVVAPASLRQRVAHGLVQAPAKRHFSRSTMTMVATLAAALIGGSVILQTRQSGTQQSRTVVQAAAPPAVGFVGVEDAMLSGDASLEDLSVEQLEQLLGEIES